MIDDLVAVYSDACGRPVSFDELCDAFKAAREEAGGDFEHRSDTEIFEIVLKHLR